MDGLNANAIQDAVTKYDEVGRDRVVMRGAEGGRNSQAEGPISDETLKRTLVRRRSNLREQRIFQANDRRKR